jgi:hypothetical protein
MISPRDCDNGIAIGEFLKKLEASGVLNETGLQFVRDESAGVGLCPAEPTLLGRTRAIANHSRRMPAKQRNNRNPALALNLRSV